MTRKWWALAALLAFGSFGCGGEELESGDAKVAWDATSKALSGGEATAAGLTTTVSHNCPEGGSMKWKYDTNLGLGDLDGFDGSSTNITYDYTVIFKGCQADGVKINGDLVYTIAVQTGDSSASTVWSYKGDLRYAGDIKGSCAIDMEGRASASASGASVEYKGSICGNDAYETLSVSATSDGATVEANGETVTTDGV